MIYWGIEVIRYCAEVHSSVLCLRVSSVIFCCILSG